MVDAAAGGSVMSKMVKEASSLYKEMDSHHYQAPSDMTIGRTVTGVLEVDQLFAIRA